MGCVRLAPSLRSQLCPFISTEPHGGFTILTSSQSYHCYVRAKRAAENTDVPEVTGMGLRRPVRPLFLCEATAFDTSPNQGQIQNTGCCSHSFSQRRPYHHISKDHCFLNKCIAERSLDERGGERNWGGGRNQDEGD